MKLLGTTEVQGSEIQTLPVEEAESATAVVSQTQEQSVAEVAVAVCRLTGTLRTNAGERILAQLATALVFPRPESQGEAVSSAAALMEELAPQNAMEAMLTVQMVATNDAALLFLRRATSSDRREVIDANLLNANRLLRLYTQQTEAMLRLKGKTGNPSLQSNRSMSIRVDKRS